MKIQSRTHSNKCVTTLALAQDARALFPCLISIHGRGSTRTPRFTFMGMKSEAEHLPRLAVTYIPTAHPVAGNDGQGVRFVPRQHPRQVFQAHMHA